MRLRGVLDLLALRVVEDAPRTVPREDARLADLRFLLGDRVDRAGDLGIARRGIVERLLQRVLGLAELLLRDRDLTITVGAEPLDLIALRALEREVAELAHGLVEVVLIVDVRRRREIGVV